jgi:hypothetical protein
MMSKKATPPTEQLLHSLPRIHVPSGYLSYFDLYEVIEKSDCYELVLHEKEELIPGGREKRSIRRFLQSVKYSYSQFLAQAYLFDY